MNMAMRVKLVVLFGSLTVSTFGQVVVPGADGSDGIFEPQSNVVIDLGLAATAPWDSPSPSMGDGVYDPQKWAVVFKYESVNIPTGVTVSFINHPSGAPVVWLVSGDVVITGLVSLNGANGSAILQHALPGPGGFRGGIGRGTDFARSAGFGPGGASAAGTRGAGGSFGGTGHVGVCGDTGSRPGPTYSNSRILPLVGGSGGAGNGSLPRSAGAGGGAIQIASTGVVEINGVVSANGGNLTGRESFCATDKSAGGGSGGGIRIVADSVRGSGRLQAHGVSNASGGGAGRIRIESNSVLLDHVSDPPYTVGFPGSVAEIWAPSSAPDIRILSVSGLAVPSDPMASFSFPEQDVTVPTPGLNVVQLEANNLPVGAALTVRVVAQTGPDVRVPAVLVSGDDVASVWEAEVSLPSGFSAIQAHAVLP